MHAALILCTALLSADADQISVRVVNTLEEPATVKFRVAGKEEWIKSELSLDAAQTRNFELPKGDKYEVVVRDENKKELPVGSWDLGKMLAKDAKAEIHIVEGKQLPGASAAAGGAKTRTKMIAVPVTEERIRADGSSITVTRTVMQQVEEAVPAGDASATPVARVKLTVFSQKQYFPIDEFINGKREEKSESKPVPDVNPPSSPPISEPPRTLKPINRR